MLISSSQNRPNTRGPAGLLLAFLCAGLLAGAAGPAAAVAPETHKSAVNEWRSPELDVAPSLERADLALLQKFRADHPAARFFAERGGQWRVTIDTRSGRPHLVEGSGLPILPGKGNGLSAEELGWVEKASGVEAVARHLRRYLADAPDVLGIGGMDLRLDPDRSLVYGKNDYLWMIELQQFHDGLEVEGARAFFRINHGNLIQMGTDRVADVRVDTVPTLTDATAWESALAELGHFEKDAKLFRDSELLIVPVARAGELPGFAYAGKVGRGYGHRLAWRFLYKVRDAGGLDREYRLSVDAHSGEILENVDLLVFATVSGKVFEETNTDPLTTVNLPYAEVTNGSTKYTNSSGHYDYSGGTATVRLDGQHVDIHDDCGPIAVSDSTTGNVDLGGLNGTDCTAPGGASTGNTNSARTAFYQLTKAIQKAKIFFPTSVGVGSWLNDTLPVNTNLNATCNAFWSIADENANFYRSGGGCSNTGELAEILLHEWGHGMDQMAGGAAGEKGTGEAVGDTFAFLTTKNGCIGDNFMPGVPCENCRSSCTGVRDIEAFAWGGVSALARPDTMSSVGCACDTESYEGPMGYEGHCESYIASTSNWDLAQLLVDEYGPGGWNVMDDVWYGSLTSAGSAYRVTSGGQCNPSATVDGCGSSNWYTVYLAVDDDDGNLMNGTPNACRIWDAFNTHGIACGDRPICTGETPACIDRPTGLVGFWPLDEAMGTEAAEVVSSREGTYVNGPYATDGKVSKGHYFHETDDHVAVPHSSSLDVGTGDFSVAAWIKTTDSSGIFLAKRQNGVGYSFGMYDGRLLLQLADANGLTNYLAPSSGPTLTDDDWHHVAVTVDRNHSSGGRFYVDGVNVHTFSPTGRQGTLSNASALTLGRMSDAKGYFHGVLDEVQLYHRSLSSSVVASLAGAGDGICRTEPLAASVQCVDLGHKFDCTATASGGTGGYSYSWSTSGGASLVWSSGSSAEVDYSSCSAGSYATVNVTVTDSSGSSKFAYDHIDCSAGGGGGPIPF